MTKITDTYRKLRPLIIDDIRAIAAAAGSGSVATGGVTDHGQLTGLGDDDHSQYLTVARGDARYALSTSLAAAGAGLTYAAGEYNVGAGYGITVNADDVALAVGVAGAGLTYTNGRLDIGAGAGITVNTNDVQLATGVAGDGLAWQSTGVLKVGAGAGLTVAADSVALTTPGTLDVASTNVATGNHTHAITSSANPGVAAALLATDSSGGVQLATVKVGAAAITLNSTDAISTGPDIQFGTNALIAAESNIYLVADSNHTLSTGAVVFAANDSKVDVGGANYIEIARFTESGRLGIGNDAPSYALDVTGAGRVTSSFYAGTMLTVDEAGQVVGIGVTPDGAATLDVYAKTTADHTVRIKQRASQTGRLWRIENTSGDELIVLDSVGNLQSGNPGFVSGLTGWQITPAGTAEFNNVWVRGELHASIFVMDEFHSNGGTFVTATAGKLENDAVLSATSDVATTNCRSTAFAETSVSYRYNGTETGDNAARSIENTIDITDPPSGHAILFTPGQVLRCKTFTGSAVYDLWLRVNSSVDMTDYYRYHVQVMSGTYTTLPAGAAVIRYGKEGDGLILQTADLQYAPYLDVFTVGADVWDGGAGAIIPHVRLGRLDGVGLPGVSGVEQYGLVAGTDLSDATGAYFVASNTQIASYRIPSTWNDGTNNTVRIESDGHVLIGTNVDTAAGVAFDFDPLNGVLRVGNSTYGGQILIYGDGDGVTNIDGANIQTGTVTADKITANSITTSQLNFTPVQTNNVVASINATAEGIRISGSRINVDGNVTFSAGYDPTTKIAAGGAAADVNANVTTISGGKITANSITADRLSVSTLSAIVADLGSITAGSIVVGSTNKLWLNDSADGALNIGGSTKASAPFQVSAAGKLTATDVSITAGAIVLDSNGATVTTQSAWSIDRGYKFKYGSTSAAGMTASYTTSPAKVAVLALWNNTTDDGSTAAISDADAYLRLKNVAGSTKTATSEIVAYQSASGKTASLSLAATSSVTSAVISADSLLFNTYKIWHENNDGALSGLDADLLDGQHGTYYAAAASYAALAGATFTGYVTAPALFFPEQGSNPTSNPPDSAGFNLYMKGDKFVIGYNHGGTMYYVTFDLSQTGGTVSWSRSSSAP